MSAYKEGALKIKLQSHTKWHRRYCTIDWDKSILFIATRADTRYRDWIKILPNILINDFDTLANIDSNSSGLLYTIGIRVDNGTVTHMLQADTKDDFDSWLIALKRTAYSRIGGGIFGQSLEETYKYSLDKSSLVPVIVRECCEHLLEHGLTFVGLFRVPGKQSAIKELRDLYDRSLIVHFKNHSPATISSLLKNYLQSLPEPIIPTKYFDEFLEIGSRFKYHQTNDLDRLKQLIEGTLPKINHAVLAYLCLFLQKLTDHVHMTKMDTDNLAVVFGNNLIRPLEELDLNMIRGHNYNLLPLIKVLINHSEYLFLNNSSNQYQDSYEQTTESATKSSGFSSSSSLLSVGENALTKESRSTSMPSIYMPTHMSTGSRDASLERNSDLEKDKRRSEMFTEDRSNVLTDYSNRLSSSLETDGVSPDKRAKIQRQRFWDTSRSMHDSLPEPKPPAGDRLRQISTQNAPISTRKAEKYPSRKAFANKFGKSLSSIKSSMSKALQSHALSNDHESHAPDSTPNSEPDSKPSGSAQASKKIQSDVEILRELLIKKDLLITELTKTSRDERMQFEQVKCQLYGRIQELEGENLRLQSQLDLQ